MLAGPVGGAWRRRWRARAAERAGPDGRAQGPGASSIGALATALVVIVAAVAVVVIPEPQEYSQ